jgi:hypothetical protein
MNLKKLGSSSTSTSSTSTPKKYWNSVKAWLYPQTV